MEDTISTNLEIEEARQVSELASKTFSGISWRWILGNMWAGEKCRYYIYKIDDIVIGYILWSERGGFRKESTWELEQLAVDEYYRGNGVGKKLVKESLKALKKFVEDRGDRLSMIYLLTGTAKEFYEKVLGVKEETSLNIYGGEQSLMVKRYD